jgi:hypothetical protein
MANPRSQNSLMSLPDGQFTEAVSWSSAFVAFRSVVAGEGGILPLTNPQASIAARSVRSNAWAAVRARRRCFAFSLALRLFESERLALHRRLGLTRWAWLLARRVCVPVFKHLPRDYCPPRSPADVGEKPVTLTAWSADDEIQLSAAAFQADQPRILPLQVFHSIRAAAR